MAERTILERIDAHMARGNELLAAVREEMRLSREERERSREMFGELYSDLREFTRETAIRAERVARQQIAELRKLGAGFEVVTDELRDMRAETRAQTRAILRVLDKLDAGGADAPA